MRLSPALFAAALLALPLAGCASSRAGAPTPTVETLAPGLTLHLVVAPFDPARYEVLTEEGSDYIVGTADCDKWHGSDGGVPERTLIEAWVVRDGQRLDLDTSCMGTYDNGYDPPDPFGRFEAAPLAEPGMWRITGAFSDGAASGEVTWTVGRTSTTRDRLLSGPELTER